MDQYHDRFISAPTLGNKCTQVVLLYSSPHCSFRKFTFVLYSRTDFRLSHFAVCTLYMPCLTATTDQPTDGSKLANIEVRLTLALSTVVCFIGLVYL